jgi:hypothetical protein
MAVRFRGTALTSSPPLNTGGRGGVLIATRSCCRCSIRRSCSPSAPRGHSLVALVVRTWSLHAAGAGGIDATALIATEVMLMPVGARSRA